MSNNMTERNSKVIAPAMQSKTEKFIQKAIEAHGDKYDYSESLYCGASKKITIICPTHGKFEQRASRHAAGLGCAKCSTTAKLTKETFIEKSKLVHGDRYDYSEVVYLGSKEKVKIKCHEHGYFKQRANAHLEGQGCSGCFKSPLGKNTYQAYCSESHNGMSNVYVIRCTRGNESFIKVGMSSFGVDKRFSSNTKLPYEFEVMAIWKNKAVVVWEKEKLIHKTVKKFSYSPKIGFSGMGECYVDTKAVLDKIFSLLTNLND